MPVGPCAHCLLTMMDDYTFCGEEMHEDFSMKKAGQAGIDGVDVENKAELQQNVPRIRFLRSGASIQMSQPPLPAGLVAPKGLILS